MYSKNSLISIGIVYLLVFGGFVVFLNFTSENAEALTIIGGDYDISQTWTPGGSPYIVVNWTAFDDNASLTIMPGTEVRFDGYYSIFVFGNLTVIGTETNRITITSNSSTPAPGDWFGVMGSDQSPDVEFKYCDVSYGYIAIHLVMFSNKTITNNHVSYNRIGILSGGDENHTIVNNTVSNNIVLNSTYWGIMLMNYLDSNVTNNTASNNGVGILFGLLLNSNVTYNKASYNEYYGINLLSSSNNTIRNNNASNNDYGIYLMDGSSNNTIRSNNVLENDDRGFYLMNGSSNNNMTNNIISDNADGIYLNSSSNNTITNNRVLNNTHHGIYLINGSSNNIITNNDISNNGMGIDLTFSNSNRIYHNNFIDNTVQAYDNQSDNYWDNGYPSGGNYWSDFSPSCPDLYDGASTPQTGTGGPDGICDNPYYIDADSIDYYPLKNPVEIVQPSDTTPSDAITDLGTSSPTTDSITLTWTAPGDDGNTGTATGYVVKYSTSGEINDANWDSATTYSQSWIPLSAGSTETQVVSGLNPSTTYWFAIKAYDEVPNYGGISNSPTGTTTTPSDTTPPDAITDLATISPTTDSITLTWTAPGDDGNTGTATGYVVKHSISGEITDLNWDSATTYTQSWTPLSAGNTENHLVSGLNPSTQYWFAIKAYDEVPNYSGISNSPSGTTATPLDTTPPDAITDLATSSPTTDSITLTWTAPGDDGNTGTATGYVVKYSTSGPIIEANWSSATTYDQSWIPLSAGSTETQVVSGLNPSTTYWFAIKAYDEVPNYGGISNSPNETTATPSDTTPPDAITDLATSSPTTGSITLTWTAPGDDGNTGTATGYVVKHSISGEITDLNWDSATTYTQSWTPLSAGSAESYMISGLSGSTQYWFAIKAYDEVSNYANISNSPNTTTISGPTAPGAPTSLIANAGNGNVNLTWDAPASDGGSVITNYRIYRGTSSGGEALLSEIGNVLYYNDTSVTNEITYHYKVSSVNAIGESTLSDEVSATPSAPVNQVPTCNMGSLSPGETISGIIEISGTASDPDGTIQKVEIKIDDGNWNQANGNTDWNYSLDTSLLINGLHTVYIRSYDGINYSTEESVSVTVNNPIPVNQLPTCTITSPSPGAIISGKIEISGTASDPDGTIERVEIKIDDGNWFDALGTTSWSYNLDTASVPNGKHRIYARSYDGVDYSAVTNVSVTVNNPLPTKPIFEELWFWTLIALVLVIVVVLLLFLRKKKPKETPPTQMPPAQKPPTPSKELEPKVEMADEKKLRLLEERYARGEISEETYKRLRKKYGAPIEKVTPAEAETKIAEFPKEKVSRMGEPIGEMTNENKLRLLEKRYLKGEVSEGTYQLLRRKYEKGI